MPMTRRDLLRSGAAAGALLLARPVGALANGLGPSAEFGTSRASRLFPGTRLAHADLHNHTLYSDGSGPASEAFASMRDSGLDIAALTDHSIGDKLVPHEQCGTCGVSVGIDEAEWQETKRIADAEERDGSFVAIRGFEWSASVPQTGHVNVWFTETWTDPIATAHAVGLSGAGQVIQRSGGPLAPAGAALDDVARAAGPVNDAALAGFYEWLGADPSRPGIGGGRDGIAGFNHPGREPGRFGYFAFQPAVADRMVSVEVFNRRQDYLYEGIDAGQPSPIVECLDNGWRTGLLGVTDEHGRDWGQPDGKGRAGVWVSALTRGGVKEAMLERRFFATVLRGLRLDAAATSGGRTARMGQRLAHRDGIVTFDLDIARGPAWTGKRLLVQVLQTGRPLPAIRHVEEVVVPADDEPVIRFAAPIDAAEGGWVVLRVSDPEVAADDRAPGEWAGLGAGIAYASPFFLAPDLV